MNDRQHPALPIRVMLVDDHKTMLWGLERLIGGEHSGMLVVATASDNASTLAQAASARPDVIVLDLDLGGVSSLAILPQLVQGGHARILVLTGSHDQAVMEQAMLNGARGIISKDAPPELVRKAIEKVSHGELWLEQAMLGRMMSQLTQPGGASAQALAVASLTGKERKIIAALVHGSGTPARQLADQLCISEHTLRNHLTSIYRKLGVYNRLELYAYATKHRLGELPPAA
nr:response regulator transcription factor [uncultured Janthinobacterium sp.]